MVNQTWALFDRQSGSPLSELLLVELHGVKTFDQTSPPQQVLVTTSVVGEQPQHKENGSPVIRTAWYLVARAIDKVRAVITPSTVFATILAKTPMTLAVDPHAPKQDQP